MKVALLLGNRVNAWHTRVFEVLAQTAGIEFTVFTYSPLRYDLGEVGLPVQQVPTNLEQRSIGARLRDVLRTRWQGSELIEIPRDFHTQLGSFDLIHSWELFSIDTAQAIQAHQRYRIPLLITVWDNIPFYRQTHFNVNNAGQQALDSAADFSGAEFLVYTQASADMLKLEGIDSRRLHHVWPGVDLAAFSTAPHTPESPPVLLGCGRMVPEKGFEELLYAAAWLRHQNPQRLFQVRLIGDGPLGPELDRLAQQAGLAAIYQRLPEVAYQAMPEHINSAAALVLPSRPVSWWQEQFGMVMLEAMAAGVPVIAAESGAIPEILDGHGWLFPSGDYRALAKQIEQVLDNPLETAQQVLKATRFAHQRYDCAQSAQQIGEVYREISQRPETG